MRSATSTLDVEAIRRQVGDEGRSEGLPQAQAEMLAAGFREDGFDVSALPLEDGLWAIYKERQEGEEGWPSREDYYFDAWRDETC